MITLDNLSSNAPPHSPPADGASSETYDGVPVVREELWTSGQRQANSLHEVSYRACFKPQLPRYFIERFTQVGDRVFDPFSGRGTTAIEAGLLGRKASANDVNPLSAMLSRPRFELPTYQSVAMRLDEISYSACARADRDLSMFYDTQTESEIVSLREYLQSRVVSGQEDSADRWIRMVATNRLTGHSPGFFSVYTFPPNQAVSAERQVRINQQRNQTPSYRNTKDIILKKTRTLLADIDDHARELLAGADAQFFTGDARDLRAIEDASVQLSVTSPPFLDVVQYAADNWLRGWFNHIPVGDLAPKITMAKTVAEWSSVMGDVIQELHRITKRGGWLAFEVGEVRNGKVKLEEHVIPLGIAAGFSCKSVLINTQSFTKTSNIWGVQNNTAGTNSNRIVLFQRA